MDYDPVSAMLELEALWGYRRVPIDSEPWFRSDDWISSAVLTTDGKVVRIVAVIALRPGTGAFRRMVDGITAAGLTPQVVSPIFSKMPAILAKWGWVKVGFETWGPKGESDHERTSTADSGGP